MPKRITDFRDELLIDLADPVEAARYLNAALEDSNQMALVALRDVADARQMSCVAEEAGVAREALYRMLCQSGNPTYANFLSILDAVGLKIEFAPVLAVGEETVGQAASIAGALIEKGAGSVGVTTIGGNSPERNGEAAPRRDTTPVSARRRRKIRLSFRRCGRTGRDGTQKPKARKAGREAAAKDIGASAPRALAIAS